MQIWSNRGTLSHTLAANLHQYGFDIKAGQAIVFYALAEKSFLRERRVDILFNYNCPFLSCVFRQRVDGFAALPLTKIHVSPTRTFRARRTSA